MDDKDTERVVIVMDTLHRGYLFPTSVLVTVHSWK